MRFYYRTWERTGVSVGPFGMLILLPLYAAALMLMVVVYAAVLLAILLVALIRRLRST